MQHDETRGCPARAEHLQARSHLTTVRAKEDEMSETDVCGWWPLAVEQQVLAYLRGRFGVER